MRGEVLIDHVGRPYFPDREKDMTMIRILGIGLEYREYGSSSGEISLKGTIGTFVNLAPKFQFSGTRAVFYSCFLKILQEST